VPENLPDTLLRTTPFFRRGRASQTRTLYHETDGSAYATEHRPRLLAACIPSLSLAAGKTAIGSLIGPGNNRNFNMQTDFRNGWPAQRMSPNEILSDRWLHNDLREVAYYFVYPLFRQMVQTGELP
jgi:hypothetical protein